MSNRGNEQSDNNINLQEYEYLPSIMNIKKAVKALKNTKAPRVDAITGEMLKNAGETVYRILHRMITFIWQAKDTLLEDWTIDLINPYTKEGRFD